jgi:ABC-type glycerol-3-phosphate transport system permease component
MARVAALPPGSFASGQCRPCSLTATPPTSIMLPSRTHGRPLSLLNSANFIAILPTLVLVVWRHVVEGLLSGALKG